MRRTALPHPDDCFHCVAHSVPYRDAFSYRLAGCHTDCLPDEHTDCHPDPATCYRDSGSHPHRHALVYPVPKSDSDLLADRDSYTAA